MYQQFKDIGKKSLKDFLNQNKNIMSDEIMSQAAKMGVLSCDWLRFSYTYYYYKLVMLI